MVQTVKPLQTHCKCNKNVTSHYENTSSLLQSVTNFYKNKASVTRALPTFTKTLQVYYTVLQTTTKNVASLIRMLQTITKTVQVYYKVLQTLQNINQTSVQWVFG